MFLLCVYMFFFSSLALQCEHLGSPCFYIIFGSLWNNTQLKPQNGIWFETLLSFFNVYIFFRMGIFLDFSSHMGLSIFCFIYVFIQLREIMLYSLMLIWPRLALCKKNFKTNPTPIILNKKGYDSSV